MICLRWGMVVVCTMYVTFHYCEKQARNSHPFAAKPKRMTSEWIVNAFSQ